MLFKNQIPKNDDLQFHVNILDGENRLSLNAGTY